MAVHIDWKQNYYLDIPQIDDQHRHFAELINNLANEFAKPNNRAYLEGLLHELVAYAKFHFLSEENLMLKTGYPHYQEHRQHHLQLIDTLSSKMAMVEIDETMERVNAMLDFLLDWFLHHTTGEDRVLANFLKTHL